MTKEEIKKAKLIKREVQKALIQILDEEYKALIKNIKEGKVQMTNKSIDEITMGLRVGVAASKLENDETSYFVDLLNPSAKNCFHDDCDPV